MMEYKGYFAKVQFDDEANIFHGEIINLRDVITFEGETVEELRRAFHDSVEDYLEFCAERGEDPEKPYSGKFIVRVDPELHKTIAIQARKNGKSLNAWVNETLLKNITHRDREEPHSSPLPHHPAYGSVPGGSADQAESDPGEQKSK